MELIMYNLHHNSSLTFNNNFVLELNTLRVNISYLNKLKNDKIQYTSTTQKFQPIINLYNHMFQQ